MRNPIHGVILVISARVFDLYVPPNWVDQVAVSWGICGPMHCRCLRIGSPYFFGVAGTRVVRAVAVEGTANSTYWLHMTDFSPSAVVGRTGRVVRGSSQSNGYPNGVATYLPSVEVVSTRIFQEPASIIMDEENLLHQEINWKLIWVDTIGNQTKLLYDMF